MNAAIKLNSCGYNDTKSWLLPELVLIINVYGTVKQLPRAGRSSYVEIIMGVWVLLGKLLPTQPAEMAVAVRAVHLVAALRSLNVGRTVGTLLGIAGNPSFRLHLLKRPEEVMPAVLLFHGPLGLGTATVVQLLQLFDIVRKKLARRHTVPSSLT